MSALWYNGFFYRFKCTKCPARASACSHTGAADHNICTAYSTTTSVYTASTACTIDPCLYTATCETRDASVYAAADTAKACTTGIYATDTCKTRETVCSTGILCSLAVYTVGSQCSYCFCSIVICITADGTLLRPASDAGTGYQASTESDNCARYAKAGASASAEAASAETVLYPVESGSTNCACESASAT